MDINSCFILNSGYNNSTYPFIKCTKLSCELYQPEKGYYYDCETKRIIEYININQYHYVNNTREFPIYYLNSGTDITNEQLISCTKNNCIVVPPREGYYLSSKNYNVIHCNNSGECKEEKAEEGYYSDSNSLINGINYILHCSRNSTNDMNCYKEEANDGFYISINSNTLINCINDKKECYMLSNKSGIYISAILRNVTNGLETRDLSSTLNQKSRNLIECYHKSCHQLTEEELMAVPVCEFSNNKCFISLRYSSFKMHTKLLTVGGYCTNYYRSQLYFATDSIKASPEEDNLDYDKLFESIDENCIKVSNDYRSYYFTVENSIYNIDDNQISSKTEEGYYFINTEKFRLVQSNDIKDYNSDDVTLYKCNGEYCSIIKSFSSIIYFVDVNQRIFAYDPSHHKYSFAYTNDINCVHQRSICQTSKDVTIEEFCVNADGKLVFLQDQIMSNASGPCTMVDSSSSEIFVFYKKLYRLTNYSAEEIYDKGYYLINNSTRVSAELKDFKASAQQIILYGCNGDFCKEYIPTEGIFYYDRLMKLLFIFENNVWSRSTTSGYANASIYPGLTHVLYFEIDSRKATIPSTDLIYGNYYTIDQKMFECKVDNKLCYEKDDTGYVLTTPGEIYYCEYNSQSSTEKIYSSTSLKTSQSKGYRNILSSCIKQKCNVGQYYYINKNYYQCKKDSIFTLMKMEQCIDSLDVKDIKENHADIANTKGFGKYIIHFPMNDKESYPDNIKYLNYLIKAHNNSTAEDTLQPTDYLPTISGVFQNCRYDLEASTMVFDLLCMNNYVVLAKDLAKQDVEINHKKDNGLEKGSMKNHDLSGVLSFLKRRANDENNNNNKNDKNVKVLKEFDLTYREKNDPFICSTRNFGYIECQKDTNNPNKCIPSQGKIKYTLSIPILTVIFCIINVLFV